MDNEVMKLSETISRMKYLRSKSVDNSKIEKNWLQFYDTRIIIDGLLYI